MEGQLVNTMPFVDRPRVTLDATSVRAKYPTLGVKQDTHVHEDGRESRSLLLHGTLPMHYQGSVYNIPVEIFVPLKYPLEPPLAYVRPTSTMDLKPGHPHMSIEGRVYLPYLNQWQGLSHNLVTLCDEMARVFGLDPPVFARVSSAGGAAGAGSGGAGARGGSRISSSPRREEPSSQSPRPPPTYRDAVEDTDKVLEKRLTERLQENLKHFYRDIGLEIDSEYSKQKTLQTNSQRIAADLGAFAQQKRDLVAQIQVAQESVSRLDLWLAERASEADQAAAQQHKADGSSCGFDVDRVLTAMDPCSEKILELVSENTAIEDALFALDRALTHDTIDITTFLREVRKLSRKQFLCRAHTKKLVEVQTTDAHPDRQHLHP